jgi:hypothetical protein
MSLLFLSAATAQTPAPPPGPRFPQSKKSVRLIGCSTATRTSSLQIDRRDPSRIDGFGRIIDLPLKPAIQKAVRADCVELRRQFGVGAPLFFVDEETSPNAVAIDYPLDKRLPDGTVLFGKKLFEREYAKGRFGIPTTIAHEFAHIMQYKRKFPAMTTKWQELHADFLAGWFTAHRARFWPDNSDPNVSARTVYESGDYQFNNPQHHGTREERFAAFRAGYRLNRQNVADASFVYTKGLEYIRSQGAPIRRASRFGSTGDPDIPFYQNRAPKQ